VTRGDDARIDCQRVRRNGTRASEVSSAARRASVDVDGDVVVDGDGDEGSARRGDTHQAS